MHVKTLIQHLVNLDMSAEINCINLNSPHDEFSDTSKAGATLASVAELDEGVALYYIGDKPKLDEIEGLGD